MFRIVETDNHGGDYPNESFVGPPLPKEKAEAVAKIINDQHCRYDHCSRFWKVVEDGYKLAQVFEP